MAGKMDKMHEKMEKAMGGKKMPPKGKKGKGGFKAAAALAGKGSKGPVKY